MHTTVQLARRFICGEIDQKQFIESEDRRMRTLPEQIEALLGAGKQLHAENVALHAKLQKLEGEAKSAAPAPTFAASELKQGTRITTTAPLSGLAAVEAMYAARGYDKRPWAGKE